MKAPLKSRRPTPNEALAIATSTAPQQPPAQVAEAAMGERDTSTTLNLRLRSSTVTALVTAAQGRGLTMKQVVCQALEAAGIAVAPSDLEDRTPRRR